MTGEIHFTREVVGRLIDGTLSQDERQALLKHIDSGLCAQCDAVDDPDDDQQFLALVDRLARLQFRVLRRRAEAGDPEAKVELDELRFTALMRELNERKKQ